MGADIERLVPSAPGLKRRSGNLELFGSLALGDALGSQLPIVLKGLCPFESIPARPALRVALVIVLD
jgi:hypothetical protein